MRKTKTIPGMGSVYDARGTGLINPNGGRINLLAMVEHIPVVPNKPGVQDFVTLGRVIEAQGLGLQAATDREGNVCIYTNLNRLCYQARGLNSNSCGVEHMHVTTGEGWTKAQLRASGWLWHYAKVVYGLKKRKGKLRNGGRGIAVVTRTGHVTHEEVSRAAGYNDRSDPGPGYDFEYVQHCANYFMRHKTMRGA